MFNPDWRGGILIRLPLMNFSAQDVKAPASPGDRRQEFQDCLRPWASDKDQGQIKMETSAYRDIRKSDALVAKISGRHAGVPDFCYTLRNGDSGWIEAKDYPGAWVRKTSFGIRPEQAIFLYNWSRAGGTALLWVRTGPRQALIFSGLDAIRIYRRVAPGDVVPIYEGKVLTLRLIHAAERRNLESRPTQAQAGQEREPEMVQGNGIAKPDRSNAEGGARDLARPRVHAKRHSHPGVDHDEPVHERINAGARRGGPA